LDSPPGGLPVSGPQSADFSSYTLPNTPPFTFGNILCSGSYVTISYYSEEITPLCIVKVDGVIISQTDTTYLTNNHIYTAKDYNPSTGEYTLIENTYSFDQVSYSFMSITSTQTLSTITITMNLVSKSSISFTVSDVDTQVSYDGTQAKAINIDHVQYSDRLYTDRTFNQAVTDLNSTSDGNTISFDGTANVTIPSPGVKGVLPVSNGGTGNTSLSDVIVGSANKLSITRTFTINIITGTAESPVTKTGTATFNGEQDPTITIDLR